MRQTPLIEQVGSPGVRRVVVLALVGVLVVSTVGGVVGSSGIAAAQQGGSDGTGTTTPSSTPTANQSTDGTARGGGGTSADSVPSQPINTITTKFEQNGFKYSKLKQWRKEKVKKNLRALRKNNLSIRVERGKTTAIIRVFDAARGAVGDDVNSTEERTIRQIIANVLNKEIASVEPQTNGGASAGNKTNGTASGGNRTSGNASVAKFVTKLKQQQLGYKSLPDRRKDQIKTNYRELATKNLSDTAESTKIRNIIQTLEYGASGSLSSQQKQKIRQIISTALGESGRAPKKGGNIGIDINIPSLMGSKLSSMADKFRKGATNVLTNVYDLAFSTPVPENTGWQGILGTPTNEPFQKLHQKLLSETLYPVTNTLLGIGVIVLGLSLTVNPLISRFRALDLIIKFAAFLMLYVFAWAAVTLMHGIVNDITVWIRPSQKAMGQLVTNVGALSAAATGAYFAGAGGILATALGLGLELGLRRVMLQYFFPYVFPVLLFVLYVSPWQRLKRYASMAIWQYVNILTMVIPMAIFLKAATLVDFGQTIGSGVKAMLVLIALFVAAASMPLISTYFFIQVPGKPARRAKSAAKGATGRARAAKDKLGWGDDDSSESTATGNTSPGERTEAAVDASSESSSGLSSSGELSNESVDEMDPTDSSETTAAEVRALDKEQHSDPMNPHAKKQAHFAD